MSKSNSFVINKDYCPNMDIIIRNGQCSGCRHYRGFEMYLGQPCVKCSFYGDAKESGDIND